MTAGSRIGTLNEAPLHADLKTWYAQADDRQEVHVDGFVIDLVRPCPGEPPTELLIEIQTSRLSVLRRKLDRLLEVHPVRVVSPIPVEKWLLKLPKRKGRRPERRKSPKRRTLTDVFREWVSIAPLIGHPNLSLEILLIHEEEVRRYDGQRGWRRRGWVTEERRLLNVVGQYQFDTIDSLRSLLPEELPTPFNTADLAAALQVPRWLTQKMAYVMRECGAIRELSRNRSGILYGCPPNPDVVDSDGARNRVRRL